MAVSIIDHLNAALKDQLSCISQCFLHARILKHRSHIEMADGEYKESIEAMKHADMLVERILALDGVPTMQASGPVAIGDTLDAIVTYDLRLKEAVRARLSPALAACRAEADEVSGRLLLRILSSVEEHIRYLQRESKELDAA